MCSTASQKFPKLLKSNLFGLIRETDSIYCSKFRFNPFKLSRWQIWDPAILLSPNQKLGESITSSKY